MIKWGILPYVFGTIEKTNLNYYQVMSMPIVELFNLTSYRSDYNAVQDLLVQQWRKTH